MSDRELLELAAKAAGYVIESFVDDGAWVYEAGASLNWDGEYPIFLWRPSHDDGDALRLAVKLVLHITPEIVDEVDVWHAESGANATEEYGPDRYTATRRAIVRAAAEIGRRL